MARLAHTEIDAALFCESVGYESDNLQIQPLLGGSVDSRKLEGCESEAQSDFHSSSFQLRLAYLPERQRPFPVSVANTKRWPF